MKDNKDIMQLVKEKKIIAIVRGIDKERILDTCRALNAGGISMIEVTFDQSKATGNQDTYEAIKLISDNLAEITVGAGTVMTVEQTELAVRAGARYIISPNFDDKVVRRTKELGAVPMPGVLTPTEIADAYAAGADFVKVFPAGSFGTGYIKSIKSPISHIPMLAVGGIGIDNVAEYMATGIDGVGIGSSLVNKTLINEGRYEELTALAKAYVSAVKGEINE